MLYWVSPKRFIHSLWAGAFRLYSATISNAPIYLSQLAGIQFRHLDNLTVHLALSAKFCFSEALSSVVRVALDYMYISEHYDQSLS